MIRELKTTNDVIEALGGNQPVAAITDRDPKAVSNWRSFKTFPADTYVALKAALKQHKLAAPDSLWGMVRGRAVEPAVASASR